jgi:hypothetical protein
MDFSSLANPAMTEIGFEAVITVFLYLVFFTARVPTFSITDG